MKEELLKAILPIIEQTKQGVAKGVDILMEQSPILVREIITFYGCKYVILFLLGCGLFSIALTAIPVWKTIKKNDCYEACPVFLFYLLPIGFGAEMISTNLIDALKVFVAPRLFLIEYISDLVK